MGSMISGWVKWLLSEVLDWLMAVWLIAGLATIIYFLSSNFLLCVAVSAVFVGVTLFFYFRFARAK